MSGSDTSCRTLKLVDFKSASSLVALSEGTIVLRSMKIRCEKGENYNRLYERKLNKFIGKRRDTVGSIVDWRTYLNNEKRRFEKLQYIKQNDRKIGVKDFIFVKMIGGGSSGDVIMSLKCDNDKFYAIKVLNKELLLKGSLVDYARNEKFVLESIRCPFAIRLEYFFQTDINLYFVLPIVLGCDLFSFLKGTTRLTEKVARFYLAQVLLSLEYLHYLDLVFRDLKPENIVMDNDGYIKLTDFGYCKIIKGRTYTICGTPEYMAPELYQHKGYGTSVDWWAYGVLVYEMCAGYSPFYTEDHHSIYIKIVSGLFKNPSYFSNELKDLVNHLLEPDMTKRYGNIKDGVLSLKNHHWFNDINWNAFIHRTAIPPYLPNLTKFEHLTKYELIEERPPSSILKKNQHIFDTF